MTTITIKLKTREFVFDLLEARELYHELRAVLDSNAIHINQGVFGGSLNDALKQIQPKEQYKPPQPPWLNPPYIPDPGPMCKID